VSNSFDLTGKVAIEITGGTLIGLRAVVWPWLSCGSAAPECGKAPPYRSNQMIFAATPRVRGTASRVNSE
jgi:hypothetical protein